MFLQKRMQVLPNDAGNEPIVAAAGKYLEEQRDRINAIDLAGRNRHLQLNIA